MSKFPNLKEQRVSNSPSLFSSFAFNTLYKLLPDYRSVESSNAFEVESGNISRNDNILPVARYVNRAVCLLLATTMAVVLPCFSDVISILGSCTISLMSFILPPILNLVLRTKPACDADGWKSWDLKLWFYRDVLLFTLGICVCVFCTTWTILGIEKVYDETGNFC